MSTISTSGINIGQIIKSEHLLRIIRTLDGTVSNDIIISGSLTLNDSATFNNGITGSLFGTSSFATTSSFAVSSSQAISSSFATTSSMTLAINGSNNRIPVFTGTRTLGNSSITLSDPQVHINVTSTLEDSAILQIDSTDRGVLFPRMTSSQRTSISNPVEGLVVWDTTIRQLCVYLSNSWYTFDLTVI